MSGSASRGEPLDVTALAARGLLAPPFPLPQMIELAAERRPDATWLATRDLSGRLSYGEADRWSRLLAGGLAIAGFRPGARMAILLPNQPAFGLIALGVWRAGGAICAMHPAYADDLLAQQIGVCEPWALVTCDDAALIAKAERLMEMTGVSRLIVAPHAGSSVGAVDDRHSLGWLASLGEAAGGSTPSVSPQWPAVLQFTGGSTGRPKAAVLTHANLSYNLAQFGGLLPRFEYGAERFLGLAPLAHITGLNMVLNLGAYFGAEVVLEPRFAPDDTARLCVERGITYFGGVPTMLAALNASSVAKAADWRHLKYTVIGGAPLPAPVKATFEQMTGGTVLPGYGLSETSAAACFGRPGEDTPEGSTGRPLPATRVEILDLADPSRRVPAGDAGEIAIAGPQVMAGYWAAAEYPFQGDLLRTGDIGRLDAAGNVYVLDRLKDLIIASGFNVYPARVEDAVATHPAVREVAVIGAPHPYRGETVVAVIALKPGGELTLEALQAHLAGRLSPIEMPRQLRLLDELPKSPAGKILRRALRDETAKV